LVIFLISLAVAFVVAALLRRSQVRLASVAAGAFTALAALAVGVGSDWSAGLDTSVAEWFDARRTSREDAEAGAAFGYVGRPFHVLTAAAVFGLPLSLRRRSVRPIGLIFGAVAVTGTAALLGSIAVCLGAGRSRAVKTVLAGLVVTAVLAVAWLALYIGAHTFTDVIGGMLLGGGIVAVCGLVYGSGAKGH
jgi:undecaprenyl-diphosphatase